MSGPTAPASAISHGETPASALGEVIKPTCGAPQSDLNRKIRIRLRLKKRARRSAPGTAWLSEGGECGHPADARRTSQEVSFLASLVDVEFSKNRSP